MERLLDRALGVAEGLLGMSAAGTAVDRCRRLEEAVWRWSYREDLPPRRQMSPLQRGLADRAAVEAELAERHMRLAETFVAVTAEYVSERPTFERLTETALLLHDGVARLRDDRMPVRPRLGARRAVLRIAAPLSVSRCWSRLQESEDSISDRSRARLLIGTVSRTIQERFEATLP
jgi:hypothetical protein